MREYVCVCGGGGDEGFNDSSEICLGCHFHSGYHVEFPRNEMHANEDHRGPV